MKTIAFLYFMLFFFFPAVSQPSIRQEPIGDHVIVISGTYFEEHMTVVSTGKGRIVVDTLTTPADTRKALEQIQGFSKEPVRFVINTHFDIDHYAGNQCFAGACFIGHANAPRHYENRFFDRPENKKDVEEMIAAIPSFVPGTGSDVKNRQKVYKENYTTILKGFGDFVFTPAEVLIDESAGITLGGMEIEIHYLGPGHTDADLVVRLPSQNILITGDLVLGGDICPVVHGIHGGSVANLLKILNRLMEMTDEKTKIIPGHGKICGREAILKQKKYLETLQKEIASAKAKGLTLDQAKQSIAMPEFSRLWLFEFAHGTNMAAAWEE